MILELRKWLPCKGNDEILGSLDIPKNDDYTLKQKLRPWKKKNLKHWKELPWSRKLLDVPRILSMHHSNENYSFLSWTLNISKIIFFQERCRTNLSLMWENQGFYEQVLNYQPVVDAWGYNVIINLSLMREGIMLLSTSRWCVRA